MPLEPKAGVENGALIAVVVRTAPVLAFTRTILVLASVSSTAPSAVTTGEVRSTPTGPVKFHFSVGVCGPKNGDCPVRCAFPPWHGHGAVRARPA